jgi:MarR family transcriptional regulator, organic hydroperoxide resistance regulator
MKKRKKNSGRSAKAWSEVFDPESDSFEVESWPFYRIARLTSRYNLRLDRLLKPIQMDVMRWRVLSLLVDRRAATVTTISEITVTKISTIAKVIQRMEVQKLVRTGVSASDARATEVSITPLGRQILNDVRPKVAGISRLAFQGLTDAELREVNSVVAKMFDNLSL